MKRIGRVGHLAAASCFMTMVWAPDAAQNQQPSGAEAGWAAIAMKIEKTSLGGFMCKPGKWVAFRCFRAR